MSRFKRILVKCTCGNDSQIFSTRHQRVVFAARYHKLLRYIRPKSSSSLLEFYVATVTVRSPLGLYTYVVLKNVTYIFHFHLKLQYNIIVYFTDH